MASQASHLNTRLESKTLPLTLRTVEPRDAPRHAALLSHPANGGDPARPFTAAASADIIARQRESAATPTVLGPDGRPASGPGRVNMVVCLRGPPAPGEEAEEQVIGLGGFGAIKDWERDGKGIRAGDTGVLLDPEFRGRGFGEEAMRLAIDWAFLPFAEGGPQLDIVTLTTLEDNAPMVRLAEEKLGLKGRGVLRPAEFEKDKQELYYEITPEEWRAIR